MNGPCTCCLWMDELNASPYPGIIRSPHLDGVKRTVKVHHIQRDNWVLLAGLIERSGK